MRFGRGVSCLNKIAEKIPGFAAFLTGLARWGAFLSPLALLFGWAAVAGADNGFMSNYIQNRFSEEGAIPVSSANKVLQTRDGYIWIAGYDGLIRFDGQHSRVFGRADGTLPTDNISALFEDSSGRLWVGTNDSGLAVRSNGKFMLMGVADGLPASSVRDIAEDVSGDIYASTVSGIVRINQQLELTNLSLSGYNPIFATDIDISPGNDLWCVLNDGSVLVLNGDKLVRRISDRYFGGLSPVSVFCAQDGTVYLGASENRVILYDSKTPGGYSLVDTGTRVNINSLYEDREGRVWVISDTGMGYIEDGAFVPVDGALVRNSLENVIEDYEGNYWFSSSRNGVLLAARSKFKDVSFAFGMSVERTVNAVTEYGGMFYIGADDGLFIRDKDGAEVVNELTEFFAGARVRGVEAGPDGMLWICTYRGLGVVRYDGESGSIVSMGEKNGLSNIRGRAVLPVAGGAVVATSEGLLIISGDMVTRKYSKLDGLTTAVILNALRTDDGVIYAGSDGGGIYRIENGVISNISEADGLGSGVILRMAADEKNSGIWVSTGNGVSFMDDSGVRPIDKLAGQDNSIFDIKLIGDDGIWLLSASSVTIASRSNLLSDAPLDIRVLDMYDGLPAPFTANSWSWLSEDGMLYIPTVEGVCGIDIAEEHASPATPKLTINSVIIDDDEIENPTGTIVIPASAARVTVNFALLTFRSLNGNSVSVFMDGLDTAPVVYPTERLSEVSFTNLKGGEYSLRLTGTNSDGASSDEMVVILNKQLGLTEEPLFWVLEGIAAVAAVFVIARLYGRYKMTQQNRLLRAVNSAASILIADIHSNSLAAVMEALRILGESVYADGAHLWRIVSDDAGPRASLVAEWRKNEGKDRRDAMDVLWGEIMPEWGEGAGPLKSVTVSAVLSEGDAAKLALLDGAAALLAIPITLHGSFWGFIAFDSGASQERRYSRPQEDILASGGLLLASAVMRGHLLDSLVRAKETALAGTKAKSAFLSRMSHEIRTPMNAVVGFSELILREELAPKVYNHAIGIHKAGTNLLSIINDILDLSKIESGRLEITDMPYYLASVFNDVINMGETKLIDKPLRFMAYIDPKLPHQLLGDETRVRQVLVNLLSNAVKYTPKGFVSFSVEAAAPPGVVGEAVELLITVADSGMGIKEEDMDKLFGDFARVNMTEAHGIEGTGLGLAITKRLCDAMGGSISFESEHSVGTTFTARIPQSIVDAGPIAAVKDPDGKSVVVFEARSLYWESIKRSCEQLGVPCAWAQNKGEFERALRSGAGYSHALIAYVELDDALRILDESGGMNAPGGVPPIPVAMANFAKQSVTADVETIPIPAHAISIANLLNGEKNIAPTVDVPDSVHFIAPDARVLVVDDVRTNLTVARGLLSPFEMRIDTCMSGQEALDLVSVNSYDIILMDHMMPDMDGIETTTRIRELGGSNELCRGVPIIALTANAVSGMKEVFLEHGMDDYVAKPIESRKLYEIIEKWIPREKRVKGSRARPQPRADDSAYDDLRRELEAIDGLDAAGAVSLMGSMAEYVTVLKQVYSDLGKFVEDLMTFKERGDWANYAIKVHAVRGVMATIGVESVSKLARQLEAASKEGDYELCAGKNSELCEAVVKFRDALSGTSLMADSGASVEKKRVDAPSLMSELENMRTACDFGAMNDVNGSMARLRGMSLNEEADAEVEKICNLAESFDYDEASEMCGALSASLRRTE
ncbi:MAG: response regulator [Synergistaceae bacterium]|jgi:signal transduction histidine kinase/ligand-binding sensor domain-containing protein/DNA-binding NarL/FixJ family response regulator/HPt (histidine-containing phosphotransfer) domain-containing protein|nr:response regulator [Synergistaceae bacterium]